MTPARPGPSEQQIRAELERICTARTTHGDPATRTPIEARPHDPLISPGYRPGIGPPPCRSRTEALDRIAAWLSYEIGNRLDTPDPERVLPAINEAAALAAADLSTWSRLEIRAELARILTRLRFPDLSPSFRAHNHRTNSQCRAWISGIGHADWHLPTWLLSLACANEAEVWPPDRLRLAQPAAWAASHGSQSAFASLARTFAAKMAAGRPVGLLTDNHGEIVIDLSFLSWLQQHGAGPLYVFAKGRPVETDIDHVDVARLVRQSFPGLELTVVPEGSIIHGNLLTELSGPFSSALCEIKGKQGLLLAKGLANLESVPGLKIDCLFLLTAKTKPVAHALQVRHGAAVGLFLPAGAGLRDAGNAICSLHPAGLRIH